MSRTKARSGGARERAETAADAGAVVPAASEPAAGAPLRLMVTREEAASMLGLSLATFDRARLDGTMPAGVVLSRDSLGRARVVRWTVDALRDAVARLQGGAAPGGRR